jgi:putative hydrolase
VDPVEALERITYLLDRDLAPAVKASAFQRAAETVRNTDPDELRTLHEEGRLKELPGIGESTSKAIAQALDGKTPDYLERLEETTTIPIGEGGEIRAALKGDCHTHSTWSDGGAPIETMARAAQDLGHDYMVLTDHSARLTIAHGLSAERLREQLKEVEQLNEKLAPFRILTGMEVDILEDGTLDMTDDMLSRLDVVVASVHSKLRMERSEMTRRMVLAMASPHTDILGHCTGRKVVGRGRPQSQFDPEIVFAACARFDKAVEINCRPERQDPPEELLTMALDWGCKVAIDTDAHAPGQLEWQPYGCDKAARLGIDTAEIVNTMDADDLVAWAAAHVNE